MVQQIDIEQGPSSSYSDPIYDRLDTVAQRISRRKPLILFVLVLVVAGAIVTRVLLIRSPIAASATSYSKAMDEKDAAAKSNALQKVMNDGSVTDYFRGRAANELVQLSLNERETAEAKKYAEQAVDFAAKSTDADLQLNARLSLAAANEDAGDFDEALKSYREVATGAGGKFPSQQLTAILGAARVLKQQAQIDEAVAQLESVINRNDNGADALLAYARVMYWQLKRAQEVQKQVDAANAAKESPAETETAPKPVEAKPEEAEEKSEEKK
jgi:tetratricopeptide (TPR) repeat protein